MRILIINGPNLNRLGKREKNIYGVQTLDKVNSFILEKFKDSNASIDFFQSDEEGVIVTKIGTSEEFYDGIVINPGAYSHYSIAILDAIRSIDIPVVEVHISNILAREDYRKKTITGEGCVGIISGFGCYSYILGVEALINNFKK